MKSPIKDNPLNNPGETLEKEIGEFVNEKLFGYIIFAAMFIALAAMEWYRWLFNVQPSPVMFSLAAAISIVYSAIRVNSLIRDLKHLKQGLAGEKVVGQYLEQLREIGAKVFHDIPANGFNLDHVVIHSSGIYVVETKTYSKPDKGKSEILCDGETLWFSGGLVRTEPIIQVTAAAKWLQDLILESTGSKYPIQPVLVFPGWFVKNSPKSNNKLWVLNPKALPAFIRNRQNVLAVDKVHMVASHLSRYIRTYKGI